MTPPITPMPEPYNLVGDLYVMGPGLENESRYGVAPDCLEAEHLNIAFAQGVSQERAKLESSERQLKAMREALELNQEALRMEERYQTKVSAGVHSQGCRDAYQDYLAAKRKADKSAKQALATETATQGDQK